MSCTIGRADVVTDEYVIEIKHYRHWKSAFGQVLAYCIHFGSRKPWVHFFGKKPSQSVLDTIRTFGERHGVRLSAEPDEY